MKPVILLGVLATLALAGCQRADVASEDARHPGRFAGVGLYPAGRMWQQLRQETGNTASAATLSDDEQVIVVVDSHSGEIRQCGNLSGYCVAMNPWAAGAVGHTPGTLTKHANQLDREAATATQPTSR